MKNGNGRHLGGPGRTRPRRLLLCLDGVPYEVIQNARRRGLFDGFGRPSRLLSPFPTLTNVALSTMLGSSPPSGYESLYFDTRARELRGGVSKYIGRRTPDKIPSSYMEELDYQEPLPFEFLVYVAPEAVWRADLRRFHETFRAAPQDRDFFAFLKGTDGLLHMRGAEPLGVALESLDQVLREISRYCGRETELVLFSDHGMNLQENRRTHLKTHLRGFGYTMTDRLARPARGEISIPGFGLCGYAALYCAREEDAPALSDALATLEGIDFSIYRELPAVVGVRGARGSARIHRRADGQGVCYRYEQLEGDPLQLAPALRALSKAGQLQRDGYATDGAWLTRTGTHTYPDALHNLYSALYASHIRHPADVLVSLHDGYYYGSAFFSRIVNIAATHGNALRGSSTAFMMSTHRHLPEVVRASEACPLLRG